MTHILSSASLGLFGIMAGFFWSFSTVVMPGIRLLDPASALAAMQAINVAVRNAVFATGFFGAALCAGALVAVGLKRGERLSAIAGAVYILPVFVVTIAVNVPINETLATLTPADTRAAGALLDRWVWWNHLRTVAAALAFLLLLISRNRDDGPATQG